MAELFFSYAEEDKAKAIGIANEVKKIRNDLSSWCYSRDQRLGIPYTDQVEAQIIKANALVLIISPHSMTSLEVKRELQIAYKKRKFIIPILYGMSSGEFESKIPPGWDCLLGTTTYGYGDDSSYAQLAAQIDKTIDVPPTGNGPGPKWPSDGLKVNVNLLQSVLFCTPEITHFLDAGDQFFVSANKGMGKTLLLKSKRALLMEQYGSDHEAKVHFVPDDSPFVDIIEGALPGLKKEHISLLSEIRSSKRIWSFAIRLSAISYFPDILGQIDHQQVQQLTNQSASYLIQPRVSPTDIFVALLSLTYAKLNKLLDHYELPLSHLFRQIHSGLFMFIDSIDQEVAHLNRQAWTYSQAGLIEAAWAIHNVNNHVKVYAAIREEAFVNYESDSSSNLHSTVLPLRYDFNQLKGVIDRLCGVYETRPNFKSFIGFNEMEDISGGIQEDSFRYLHRHSIGRPRDLVMICHELSKHKEELEPELFQKIVVETSSRDVLRPIFQEMKIFLDALQKETDRLRFFQMIPQNILTRPQIEAICCQFNNCQEDVYADLSTIAEELRHPFCELYNCGLIGYIHWDAEHQRSYQYFKQPVDIMQNHLSCLPKAPYYVLHPSLRSQIDKSRQHQFLIFPFIRVGHHCTWYSWYGPLMQFISFVDSHREHRLYQQSLQEIKKVVQQLHQQYRPEPETLIQLAGLWEFVSPEASIALEELVAAIQK